MSFSSTPRTLASIAAGLLAALVPGSTLIAQQPQAIYPLLVDLLDTTSTYGPVALTGNPTPPAAPANGVCVNGIYSFSTGGQDVRLPLIGSLDPNDFEFTVEFNIAGLPAIAAPVFMGGNSFRWLGIYVNSVGIVGLKHNNSNFAWSTTTLTTGRWYIGTVKFEAGTVELIIDGNLVLQASIGALNTGNNHNFTTNDFSNGRNHNGCIRNVVISNDTTLGNVASATNYGSNCGGLAMTASALPRIGNGTFGLTISNVPLTSPLIYVALGQSIVNPGTDLTAIGMAGCYSYTNLGIGVFGPAPAMGGSGTFPLPIPNDPSMLGLILYSQGISLSTATSLGVVTSNGTQLVLGT